MAEIRVSSAERDDAVVKLGEHLTSGRLELAEYDDRCARAVAARTRGDLEELFVDLPAPHPDLSSATPPLLQKAGQLVRPGKKDVTSTKSSQALEVIASVFLFIGIPGAILLTIFAGAWWVFIPVSFGLIGFGSAAESAKKPAQ